MITQTLGFRCLDRADRAAAPDGASQRLPREHLPADLDYLGVARHRKPVLQHTLAEHLAVRRERARAVEGERRPAVGKAMGAHVADEDARLERHLAVDDDA